MEYVGTFKMFQSNDLTFLQMNVNGKNWGNEVDTSELMN